MANGADGEGGHPRRPLFRSKALEGAVAWRAMAERTAWTREQLVMALSLYCQIPFGKMHQGNPQVIALAQAMGRTPSAVALRLSNFASLDPELKARGIVGMTGISEAGREVWEEYYGKWETLAEHALPGVETAAQREAPEPPEGPTQIVREVAMRRGQGFFRSAVLAAYDGKCCITGIACDALLRASHIVPWAADETLRLDPRNGLCLNALHDAAFDRGLITIGERFELLVSKRLKDEVTGSVWEEMFASREGRAVALPERFGPRAEGLAWHRGRVWKG